MMFFFFQAEDGIRDYKVTGVQTCALPIFAEGSRGVLYTMGQGLVGHVWQSGEPIFVADVAADPRTAQRGRAVEAGVHGRSEERRVGKEGRERRAEKT